MRRPRSSLRHKQPSSAPEEGRRERTGLAWVELLLRKVPLRLWEGQGHLAPCPLLPCPCPDKAGQAAASPT